MVLKIKRGKILGQFDSPGADGAGAFKGQEALVAQIGFKQTGVVAAGAGDDGLRGSRIINKTVIGGALTRVFAIGQQRGLSHAAAEQR